VSAKWACLACRITYNREHPHCPRCGESLNYAGRFFKPPRRNATRQWQAIEILLRGGVTFDAHQTHLVTPKIDRFIGSRDDLTREDIESALREVEWALEYFKPPVAIHDHAVPTTPRAAKDYLEWVAAERQRYVDIKRRLIHRFESLSQ
jgi:hypothetical protein